MTVDEETTLRARSGMLTAIGEAAVRRRAPADVYADLINAWKNGVLTDSEFAALGTLLRVMR